MPPNQLLQFMWDVNQAAYHQGLGLVFKTMELGTQKESTPYDSFQREYIRAFKRWKTRATGGNLPSDAVAGAYAGERADIWTNLAECGGREAPEVDHVDPSYQSGENSYMNARLVSFQHNHMYREKKTAGSKKVCVELLEMYQDGRLAFWNKPNAKYSVRGISHVVTSQVVNVAIVIPVTDDLATLDPATKLNQLFEDNVVLKGPPNYLLGDDKSAWKLNTPQRALVDARKGFLESAYGAEQKQAQEASLDHKYKRASGRHDAALQHFMNSAYGAHAGRTRLRGLITAAGMPPLCEPSDDLRDAGGLLNPTAPEQMPNIPDATATSEYKAALKAFAALKKELKF